MEIERKYLILNLPENLSGYRSKKIEQAYLCHNPTVRIRKSNDDYILTYKSKLIPAKSEDNKALIHEEVELMLTEEAYQELKAKTDGGTVYKTRYLIPLEAGLTAELDLFEGKLQGLNIVEVEFPDEETANKFVPPAWFGKELSSDRRFSNYHLSRISDIKELEIDKSI